MSIRKNLAITATAVAALLPLAACQTDGTPITQAADVSTPITAPSSDTSEDTTDAAFLAVVGEQGLPRTQVSIDAAKAMCRALDRGASPEQVALIALREFDGDIDKTGALLGAGAAAYCPEHSDELAHVGQGTGA